MAISETRVHIQFQQLNSSTFPMFVRWEIIPNTMTHSRKWQVHFCIIFSWWYTYVQAVTQISIQTETKQAAKQSLNILLLTFCPLELQKLLHKAAIICKKVFSRWRRKFNFNALLGRPVKTTKPLLNHCCAHNYYKDINCNEYLVIMKSKESNPAHWKVRLRWHRYSTNCKLLHLAFNYSQPHLTCMHHLQLRNIKL